MQPVKGTETVVNTLTGEVTQYDYDSPDQLRDYIIEIDSYIKTLERLKSKLKHQLEEALTAEEYEFKDGSRVKWVRGETIEYSKSAVFKYITDEDQRDIITKIDPTALKALVKELNKDGALPAGAWKDIEDNSTHKAKKPYILFAK